MVMISSDSKLSQGYFVHHDKGFSSIVCFGKVSFIDSALLTLTVSIEVGKGGRGFCFGCEWDSE